MTGFNIVQVDLNDAMQSSALLELMNGYAQDPMGGGKPLAESVQNCLIENLKQIAGSVSLLAYMDAKPVGLLNAFTGFSTFSAKPLFNVHDVYVVPEYRRQGVMRGLFEQLEAIAGQKEYCKITLEVLAHNQPAARGYAELGFSPYELDPECGTAMFWHKQL